jgi:hypothetical protein
LKTQNSSHNKIHKLITFHFIKCSSVEFIGNRKNKKIKNRKEVNDEKIKDEPDRKE